MSGQIKRSVTFGMGFISITSIILKLPTVFISEDLIVSTNDRQISGLADRVSKALFFNCSFPKVKAICKGVFQTAHLSNSIDNSCSTGTAELTSTQA